jgi:hypothetical protein
MAGMDDATGNNAGTEGTRSETNSRSDGRHKNVAEKSSTAEASPTSGVPKATGPAKAAPKVARPTRAKSVAPTTPAPGAAVGAISATTRPARLEAGPVSDDVVSAGVVNINQGGAAEVEAESISIHQGGIGAASAEDITITAGGIGMASADDIAVRIGAIGIARGERVSTELGPIGLAIGREVSVKQGFARFALGRDIRFRQGGAGTVAAANVTFEGQSGALIVVARKVEARWAEYCGVAHAVAVSNGTVALMSIFAGLGLGPGDEVITVSHTFNATVSSILFTGASPVFHRHRAGHVPHGCRPDRGRHHSTDPGHLPGQPLRVVADMDAIQAIADRTASPSSRTPARRTAPCIAAVARAASATAPSASTAPRT